MNYKFLSLFAAFTFLSAYVFAVGTPPVPQQAVPVDGGVLVLAAAAGAYGYKKIKDSRKAKSDSAE